MLTTAAKTNEIKESIERLAASLATSDPAAAQRAVLIYREVLDLERIQRQNEAAAA